MKKSLLIGCIAIVVLGLCAGVAVLVFGVALTGDDTPAAKIGNVAQPPATAAPQTLPAFRIGDVIETSEWGDDWTLTVHSVHYPTGEGWHPKDGHKFVMLDMELVNTSDDAQTLSTILAYDLKDSENREYDSWISSAAPGEEPGGDFAPGEAKRGPVVFQVAEGATGFIFVFEPAAFGSERVFVTLQ